MNRTAYLLAVGAAFVCGYGRRVAGCAPMAARLHDPRVRHALVDVLGESREDTARRLVAAVRRLEALAGVEVVPVSERRAA